MEIFCGVDIGGTETKIGLFSEDAEILEKWSIPTDLRDAGMHIMPNAAKEISEGVKRINGQEKQLCGIGMGIPGPVDDQGYVKTCVNLNWKNFDPVKELQAYFPEATIIAENDANVAALGEYHKGAGKKYFSMMLVTLGTGVGGGIILDGKVLRGAHGLAGEIGHIGTGKSRKTRCNCGNQRCVDQWASATGIVSRYLELSEMNGETGSDNREEKVTAKTVFDLAKTGDALAVQCVEECMEPLGRGLAFFSHAFDPEVYVIGGGVSNAGELLLEKLRESYQRYLFLVSDAAEIVQAKLGNDAGMIGACILAIEKRRGKGE